MIFRHKILVAYTSTAATLVGTVLCFFPLEGPLLVLAVVFTYAYILTTMLAWSTLHVWFKGTDEVRYPSVIIRLAALFGVVATLRSIFGHLDSVQEIMTCFLVNAVMVFLVVKYTPFTRKFYL